MRRERLRLCHRLSLFSLAAFTLLWIISLFGFHWNSPVYATVSGSPIRWHASLAAGRFMCLNRLADFHDGFYRLYTGHVASITWWPGSFGFIELQKFGPGTGDWMFALDIPLWMPVALFTGTTIATAALRRRARRQDAMLICANCGYDLSGRPAAPCPECGKTPQPVPVRSSTTPSPSSSPATAASPPRT